jgi:signal transduction histidine kinase
VNQLSRIFPKVDPFSLQTRLTIGVATFSALGLASLASWTSWKMQEILIDDRLMFIAMVKSVTIASIFVIIIISAIIACYIKYSLQPLRHISQMAAAIKPENLAVTKVDLNNAPSEVKELAKTVNMMLFRLSEAWEKERQFTSNISHELRTPLTIVSGYLQSMLRRKQNLTEIQVEALETAASETENTIHMLEDLLDLARADSGYLRFSLASYAIDDLVIQVVEMASKNSSRKIEIEVESHPIIVKVDHQCFTQVLLNLIDNAVKYSDHDTKITLKLKRFQNKGIIQVCDRGCGIALQHQSRIFDRFYRIDEARTRSTGSTGLGLSIVKTFVEGMGGNVTVKSQVGEGSVFTVILPCLSENTSDR